jgi:hypothetical protein
MTEERAIKRYENEIAQYERELEEFRALSDRYERELKANPDNKELRREYAELQERRKRLTEYFERLKAQRDIIA